MQGQWLAYDDLVQYDEKIKSYIAKKDELIKNGVYSKEDIDAKLLIIEELKNDLKDLEVLVRSQESTLKDLKDHIDEDEAAILNIRETLIPNLETADDEIRQQIANVRVDAETKYGRLNTKLAEEIGKVNAELNNKLDEEILIDLATKSDIENLATTEYVKDAIRDAQLGETDIDLSDYAKKDQVNEISKEVTNLHNEIKNVQNNLDQYITESELELLNYATKDYVASQIPSPDAYATKDSVSAIQEQVGRLDVKLHMLDSDLVDINNKLDNIPTKTSELVNDAGFITAKDIPEVDLTDYAKKSDIPDVTQYITKSDLDSMNLVSEDKLSEEYATKESVAESIVTINEKIDNIELPTKLSDLQNDANFATEQYVVDHMNTTIETEVETQVTEVVEKQVTEVVQTQVKDEVAVAIENNTKIQYGEF